MFLFFVEYPAFNFMLFFIFDANKFKCFRIISKKHLNVVISMVISKSDNISVRRSSVPGRKINSLKSGIDHLKHIVITYVIVSVP